ncbi:type II toxin-antitoxin system PemK/MazF family toxin [Synechocystis salina LEGE 06099]|uniref:type II toxin-antitoxin system PemK/MazF family toxin n=1 Tax=Synechocystis salina TaxID=945780 RepID=UPI00187F9FE6|nr:type II toxin-antitoxin system PemK/MazF family toxin [Synechocystis salina]MBE9204624.1 type II toxin-antitoxin system PemK/MazF family toxin [Synechocystis salina LEGE 06099]
MVRIGGIVPKRGQIIFLELNPRIGSEQSGDRPALVISPTDYNGISRLILICPITSRAKGWPFEVQLPPDLEIQGVVLVDQIRAVDCQARNVKIVEEAPTETMMEVLARLETLVSLS